jgi:hypothetical protein
MQHHDERYLDAIDRALDSEASEGVIERGTLQAIDRLRVLAAVGTPRQDWEFQMDANRALSATSPEPRTRRFSLSTEPRRSLAASVSIVIAIVLLASFVIISGNGRDENSPLIAVESSPSALTLECIQDSRNEPFPPTLVSGSVITAQRHRGAAWVARQPVNIDVVKQSELPQGTVVDHATYAAVFDAVAKRMACRNAGFANWNDFVMMDPGNAWPKSLVIPSTPTLPGTLAWFGAREVPNILRMDDLGDGNVGVMLQTDFFDYQLSQYDVYRQIDGNWSLVDSALYAADGAVDSMGVAEVPTSGQFTIWDIYLAPNIVYLQANHPDTIEVINNASESYILSIPELDVWIYLESGDTQEIDIDADPGVYAVEMLQPGVTTPKSTRQLRVVSEESAATPVS